MARASRSAAASRRWRRTRSRPSSSGLRESLASLETVEREAADGDFLVVDFLGTVDGEAFEGGEARGYLLELGSGRLVEGFEEQLRGAEAGDEREVRVTFPDDYREESLAGRDAVFAVTVKEVKEKRLPELDDDFAVEAGGYDTLDELRERDRVAPARGRRARDRPRVPRGRRRRRGARGARSTCPHELVHAKAHEMWHRTARRMAGQGIDPQQYLQLTGKNEEELVTEAEPDAERALRRESVLAAIVEAEGIEVSDDELKDALREAPWPPGASEPSEKALERSLKRARAQGADEALREDIAMRKAVDLVVEHAKAIPAEQAQAREKLWTPEKEESEKPGQLWTPGS